MADNLVIEGTNKTPLVKFMGDEGTMELSGKSIPENSFGFYQPLMQWLERYVAAPKSRTEVNIILEYFNTSSSKCLLDIFRKLEGLKKTNQSDVVIMWHYEEDDEDMMEAGQDYESLVDLKFSLVKI